MKPSRFTLVCTSALLCGAVIMLGCSKDSTPAAGHPATSADKSATPTAPKASASSPPSSGSTSPPTKKPPPKPYDGPVGTLTGTVTLTGDAPPKVSHTYPKGCEAAAATYGTLFRTGQQGALADALVTVTNYKGYVPPSKNPVKVTIRDCAFSTRTIALADGQHIEVSNLDTMRSYLPYLDGNRATATNVTIPRGAPVKLYSRGRQRYWLRDQMARPFMVADVFHLPYSTFSVTDLTGTYRIEGLPVGDVQVNVMLPATKNMKHITRKTTIEAGTNRLDLSFPFSEDTDAP